MKTLFSSFSLFQIILIFGIVFLDLYFIVFIMRQNRFIYYWDRANYWTMAINQTQFVFSHSPGEIISGLTASINRDDYNLFLPTVISLPMKILGGGYTRYVFINSAMFFIPASLVQALTATKIVRRSVLGINRTFIIALGLTLCFPVNYYAIFRGYIDVAFVFFAAIAMYLFIDYDFCKVSVSRDIAIALMLVLIWVSRRYAIYFIIGYVVALFIKGLFCVVQKKRIKTVISNIIIIGGLSLGVLLIFFRQFVLRALLTDYGNMYSAYDAALLQKFKTLASSFGYFFGIIILIATILCVIYKRHRINLISILAMMAVTCILFWQTQNMGVHHRMMLTVPAFLVFIFLLDFVSGREDKPLKAKVLVSNIAVMVCILFMIANFLRTFFPSVATVMPGKIWSANYTPQQRDDIDTLYELGDYLNNLTAGTEDTIYLTASNGTINSSLMQNLYLPAFNAVPHLLHTHDVDLRDGFPAQFLTAKYVVATEPTLLHLASGQEVVRYLNEMVADSNSYLGCHFSALQEFELDGKVKVTVYEKASEFSASDLEKMREYYTGLYPEDAALFTERISVG